MIKYRQLSFKNSGLKLTNSFGGSLLKKSNAKIKRPLSSKLPIHVVLRSDLAKGKMSLLNKQHKIKKIIHNKANQFGIKIYSYANAGNHLHLLVRIRASNNTQAKFLWSKFIRSITGLIARLITGSEKSSPAKTKFWTHKPFTRLVRSWCNDFKQVKKYIFQNELETLGIIRYRPRKARFSSS